MPHNARMRCEIYPVDYQNTFRWKWRHVAADGSVEESREAFALYYECLVAARTRGYEPPLKVAPKR
jgi:hypothetical protein